MNELISIFSGFGWYGVITVLVILVIVFIARKAGVLANGDQARIANILVSAIMFGLSNDPRAEAAIHTAIASLLSALIYEGLKLVGKRIEKNRFNAIKAQKRKVA